MPSNVHCPEQYDLNETRDGIFQKDEGLTPLQRLLSSFCEHGNDNCNIMATLSGTLCSSKDSIAFSEGHLYQMAHHMNMKRRPVKERIPTQFGHLLHALHRVERPPAFSSYSFVTHQVYPSTGLLSCLASVLFCTDHSINSILVFGFNGETFCDLSREKRHPQVPRCFLVIGIT